MLVQKNIGWLQVSVDQTRFVGMICSLGRFGHDLDRRGDLDRTTPQSLFQCFAIDQLHHDERLIGINHNVTHVNQPGMADFDRMTRFGQKLIPTGFRVEQPASQQLDSTFDVEQRILCGVDIAERTFTEKSSNLITPDCF